MAPVHGEGNANVELPGTPVADDFDDLPALVRARVHVDAGDTHGAIRALIEHNEGTGGGKRTTKSE